jgi:Plasmid pRiA4b ORF-3-like protein
MSTKPANTYQLKISLTHSKPPIWRRILVPDNINLADLHTIIQIVMGWENCHLHQFIADRVFYAPQDDYDTDMETKDEAKTTLSKLLKKPKDKLDYEYDFGDSWLHKIELEKVLPFDSKAVLPTCIKGKLACPPEDSGGIWSYGDFMDAIANPDHPEREELMDWLGDDFDPEYFNIDAINADLAKLNKARL